ncbi:mitochondrial acyl carrier protein [Entomophthora muscae]|uniref:Mitochondrial acyl carrier protein n=1 Tax=Entomophthora muscae TaxID=34485 RepID=A0ACC2RGW5_9FUNG|nr:mitochondrial acyl carrier protein [Entomophthora muscae]
MFKQLSQRSILRSLYAQATKRSSIVSLRTSFLPTQTFSVSSFPRQEKETAPISSIPKDVIYKRIHDVLKKYGKIDESKISETAHFSYDLKLDSLDTVEVVMAIEEEFSIEIPDHDADEIKTVTGAINYVASRSDAH